MSLRFIVFFFFLIWVDVNAQGNVTVASNATATANASATATAAANATISSNATSSGNGTERAADVPTIEIPAGKTYVFVDKPELTWYEARDECKRRGGDLAMHLTFADIDRVGAIIRNKIRKDYDVFIGGWSNNQANETNLQDNFEWLTGETIPKNLWPAPRGGTQPYYYPGHICLILSGQMHYRRDGTRGPAPITLMCDSHGAMMILCEFQQN